MPKSVFREKPERGGGGCSYTTTPLPLPVGLP